ncbi:hypothetical protein GW17_00036538 [Ensete ventricosum]|nr:hypothetical protein GW17_00036538 [Ensete ventricosum]
MSGRVATDAPEHLQFCSDEQKPRSAVHLFPVSPRDPPLLELPTTSLFMTRPLPEASRRRSLEITMDASLSSPSHGSLKNDAGLEAGNSSAGLLYDGFDDEPRHFLDCCSLCWKPLASNRDIFMYRFGVQPSLLESFAFFVVSELMGGGGCRGDTPFCSEECRQEQIEIDEAGEKSRKLSVKVSRSRKERRKSGESQKIRLWADTSVAG